MRSADVSTALTRLERRLDEMQRRTMSTLSVTNPADGITYLRVANGHVQISDPTGALVLDAVSAPNFGYNTPWPNYVMFPDDPTPLSDAFTGPYFTTAVAVFYPSQPRLDITTKASLYNGGVPATGGIAEWQLQYTVNGGAPVLISPSVGSTTTPDTPVIQSYSLVWPGDYFTDKIRLLFQARIRPGTGDPDFDEVLYAPIRLYGSPQ